MDVACRALATPDADEAMWTLMSRHVLNGEFPAYFWGQAYGGTIEVYLATPVRLGLRWRRHGRTCPPVATRHALQHCLSTLLDVASWGRGAQQLRPLVFWMWPAYTAFKSTRVNGFYLSGQILVLLVLLLVLRLAERPKRVDAVAIGFVLGLAAWQTLQVLPIVLPALAWLAWRRPSAYKLALLAVPGLVLGSLPGLVFERATPVVVHVACAGRRHVSVASSWLPDSGPTRSSLGFASRSP